MKQYNEGKEYKVNRTIKIFEFENTRSDVKVVQSLRKKGNQYVKQIISRPTGRIYLQKLTLILTLQMN